MIAVCVLLGMACSALFSVYAQTYFQQQTPVQLLGKVSSFVGAITMCAMPLGQAMYGVLFKGAGMQVWAVVVFGAVTSLLLTVVAGKVFSKAEEPEPNAQVKFAE